MKNVIILVLVAAALFGISAGLSLWLNQPKVTEESKEKESATASNKKSKEKESGEKGDDLRPVIRPGAAGNTDEAAKLSAQLREQMATLREREGQLDRRQGNVELVLQDIKAERESLDKVRSQLSVELKAIGDRMVDVEKRFGELDEKKETVAKSVSDLEKRSTELSKDEKKNVDKMATMYDSMPPENAAKIMQQMADSGKMDTAVKLLSQMKERQAAKVLAEMPDAALAAQLLEKMRGIRRPSVTPTPAPDAN